MMVAPSAGLQAIDSELLDASAVDGASAPRRFGRDRQALAGGDGDPLGILWTLGWMFTIFSITQGGSADATQILVTYSYRYSTTSSTAWRLRTAC